MKKKKRTKTGNERKTGSVSWAIKVKIKAKEKDSDLDMVAKGEKAMEKVLVEKALVEKEMEKALVMDSKAHATTVASMDIAQRNAEVAKAHSPKAVAKVALEREKGET